MILEMLRLRKIKLFMLIAALGLIFFTIQLMFSNKINFDADIDYAMINGINPKFNKKVIRNENSEILFQKIKTNGKKRFKKVKVTELVVPLNSNQQPFLLNMLPFYHKNHFLNFSHIMIDSLVLMDDIVENEKQQNSNNPTFLSIEEENRIKSKTVFKDSDIVELDIGENQPLIKGVKLDKIHLYRPDSNNLFKCINSNVSFFLLSLIQTKR